MTELSVSANIHGVTVVGRDVDDQTRCAHYHSERDIIAIKFKCCGKWFCCYACHAEVSEHEAVVWPKEEFDAVAVLCGGCGAQLSIRQYLDCDSVCPHCNRQFNRGCLDHCHLYFKSCS
jgi:uncharacterized CHY-type Zn-finger protein